MRFVQIKNNARRISECRLLKSFLILILFYSIAMLSPLVVDDYYFSGLRIASFSEYVNYVLHYGNGRVLGNLSALYLVKHPIIRNLVKALIFLFIGFFMTRIVDSVAGGKNEKIVFLLLIAMAPQFFAQVFSWTSGFCNYVPPILCSLYLAQSFLFSDRKQGWIEAIVACLVGGGGELFVEHSALINFTLVCCIFVYCIIRKRNVIQALLCWMGTFLGLIAIFVIPRIFVATTGFENYQKLNLREFHGFLVSVVANTMQICEEYGAAAVLWGVMSVVMLGRCRRQKNGYIITTMLLGFPIYSGMYYVLTHYVALSTGILMGVFNTVITLGYLGSILCVIIRMEKTRVRNFSFVLFFLGLYSVSPLLIVYPIGERCLFHSYIALAMLAAVNYADVFRSFGNKHIDASGSIAVLLAVVLLLTYCRIFQIDEAKKSYIEMCMENQKREILIPKIPSDYIHSHENLMITNAYFYDEPGDITFIEVEYNTWLERR